MKNRRVAALLCSLLLVCVVPGVARAGIEDGLAASLPLQDDLKDHSAGHLPVKVHGTVALQNGSAHFGGNGNYLELPHIPFDNRDFAVSMWVCPTGNFPTYGLLQQWDRDETGHILHLLIREGLHPWLGFYVNDLVSPVNLTNAGVWQHVVFQYVGGAQEIWINGRFVCRRFTAAYQGTSGATLVGSSPKWNNVPLRDFEGNLSDVRIYSRALKAGEVRHLARLQPPELGAAAPAPAAPAAAGETTDALADVPLLSINGGSMRVSGKPGQTYTVEGSDDLQKWAELGTVIVGAEGTVDIVDDDASKHAQRFYRLRFLPSTR